MVFCTYFCRIIKTCQLRSLKSIYQQHKCMCVCCYKWSVVHVAGVLTHSEVLTMHFLSCDTSTRWPWLWCRPVFVKKQQKCNVMCCSHLAQDPRPCTRPYISTDPCMCYACWWLGTGCRGWGACTLRWLTYVCMVYIKH